MGWVIPKNYLGTGPSIVLRKRTSRFGKKTTQTHNTGRATAFKKGGRLDGHNWRGKNHPSHIWDNTGVY